MYSRRCGKAHGATHETLDPGPSIEMLACNVLRVLFAHCVLLGVDMALVGAPPLRGRAYAVDNHNIKQKSM